MISEFIYKGEHCKVLLFKMSEGTFLKAHSSPSDVMIHICKGSAEINSGDKSVTLNTGDYVFSKANEKHAVKAIGNLEFCLTKLQANG